MSWFFKVARGWAPYAAAQSERLEAGFQLFQAGSKEHVVLDDWRVDLERMIQYRADDPSRSRPVKREGPPAASASSGQGPAKRQKLLLQLVEAKDEELFSDLSLGPQLYPCVPFLRGALLLQPEHYEQRTLVYCQGLSRPLRSSEDLKKVADRLVKLQAGCQGRIKAAVPGKGTEEKDPPFRFECNFQVSAGFVGPAIELIQLCRVLGPLTVIWSEIKSRQQCLAKAPGKRTSG